MCFLDCAGLEIRIVRLLKAAVPRLGESKEAAWKSFVVAGNGVLQPVAIAAGEVHHGGEIFPVHHRSEEHTSELQSPCNIVCRLLLEKKTNKYDTLNKRLFRTPLGILAIKTFHT